MLNFFSVSSLLASKILLWEKYCNYPLTTTMRDRFASWENILDPRPHFVPSPHSLLGVAFTSTRREFHWLSEVTFVNCITSVRKSPVKGQYKDSFSLGSGRYEFIGMDGPFATPFPTIWVQLGWGILQNAEKLRSLVIRVRKLSEWVSVQLTLV